MKGSELKERTTEDLGELQSALRKDLFSYRMKNYTGQLANTSLLAKTRKDLARVAQVLHERRVKEPQA